MHCIAAGAPLGLRRGGTSILVVPETQPRLEDTLIRGFRDLARESPRRSPDAILRALDDAVSGLFLVVSSPRFLTIA